VCSVSISCRQFSGWTTSKPKHCSDISHSWIDAHKSRYQRSISQVQYSSVEHRVGSPSQWITSHWLFSPLKSDLAVWAAANERIMAICWPR
jgi:hypothetical protein